MRELWRAGRGAPRAGGARRGGGARQGPGQVRRPWGARSAWKPLRVPATGSRCLLCPKPVPGPGWGPQGQDGDGPDHMLIRAQKASPGPGGTAAPGAQSPARAEAVAILGQSEGWKPRVSENGGRRWRGDVLRQAPWLKRSFQGTRFCALALPSPLAEDSFLLAALRHGGSSQEAWRPPRAPRPPWSLTSAKGVRAGPRRAVSRAGGQLVGAGGWLRLVRAAGRQTAVPADCGCSCRVLGFRGAGRGRGRVRTPACQPKAQAHRDTCAGSHSSHPLKRGDDLQL